MWLINKWEYHNIDVKTLFLYVVLEEEFYTKITEGISEVIEEHYMYRDILKLIKSIYGIVQAARC